MLKLCFTLDSTIWQQLKRWKDLLPHYTVFTTKNNHYNKENENMSSYSHTSGGGWMKSKSDTINLSSPFRADVAAWFVLRKLTFSSPDFIWKKFETRAIKSMLVRAIPAVKVAVELVHHKWSSHSSVRSWAKSTEGWFGGGQNLGSYLCKACMGTWIRESSSNWSSSQPGTLWGSLRSPDIL